MFDDKRPGARLIGAALVGVMIFGTALGAEAATKKKHKVVRHTRTVTLSYKGGCSVDTPEGAVSDTSGCSGFGGGGWEVPTQAGEKYVSVTVTDATGRNVAGAFWEGSGTNSTTTDFCGSMKDFTAGPGSVVLALDAVGARTACPGLATQGTVKLVFSNLP